jgi:hypothetical protein
VSIQAFADSVKVPFQIPIPTINFIPESVCEPNAKVLAETLNELTNLPGTLGKMVEASFLWTLLEERLEDIAFFFCRFTEKPGTQRFLDIDGISRTDDLHEVLVQRYAKLCRNLPRSKTAKNQIFDMTTRSISSSEAKKLSSMKFERKSKQRAEQALRYYRRWGTQST